MRRSILRYSRSAYRLVAVMAFVFLSGCESRPDTVISFPYLDGGTIDSQSAAQLDGLDQTTIDAQSEIDGQTAIDAQPGTDSTFGLDNSVVVNQVATGVVLPDTQFYSESFPDIYKTQTQWIVDQAKHRNIRVVLHLGDIVDRYDDISQWTNANKAMRLLDGVVPYLLVPGNHDMDIDLNARTTPINEFFAPQTLPWVVGTFETGKIENNFFLVDIGPHKYLVIGLEWGPRNAALVWADSVLKSYAAYPAIVVTHAFLDGDSRYDYAKYPGNIGQSWNPHWYADTYASDHKTPVAEVNDGEEIYQKLVLPNPNVRIVLGGHVLGDTSYGAVGRLTDTRTDGSHIHQMLANYQTVLLVNSYCGLGYLRMMEFDTSKMEIRVSTYSPYLDKLMSVPEEDATFSLPLDD